MFTVKSANPPKQIAASNANVSGVLLYTVPIDRTFTGVIVLTGAQGVIIGFKGVNSTISGQTGVNTSVNVTLLGNTTVTSSGTAGLALIGVET